MKKRASIFYALYFILLLIGVYFSYRVLEEWTAYANREAKPELFFLIASVIYVFMGALLGTVLLYDETSKKGKWKADPYKLIIVGVPLFYLFPSIQPIPFVVKMLTNPSMVVYRIAFGFILVSSFYK